MGEEISHLATASLLGGFKVMASSGADLTPRGRKACCMLAVLLVIPDGRISRERLSALLWSDRGEEQARGSLRQALAEIRRTLGTLTDELLSVDRAYVSLSKDRISCDFDVLFREVDANESWSGDLLDGFGSVDPAFDDWLRIERTRLRDRWRQRLERRLERTEEIATPSETLKAADELVTFDPSHESAHRAAMRAYAEMGQSSAALRQYEKLEDSLTRFLDAVPSPETTALVERIRHGKLTGPGSSPPQSAEEPEPARVSVSRHSPPNLAVLPMVNLSGDSTNSYLCEGLSDELITCLSKLRELQVLSRHASFTLRDSDINLPRIRETLEANYVLHGSIMRSEDRIRLNLHLSDTTTSRQMWAERFDRKADDLLKVIDEVIDKVRSAILPALESVEASRLHFSSTESLAAYDHYLRGKFLCHGGDHRKDAKQAVHHLEQALELDPEFDAAMTQLVRLYNTELLFDSAGGPLADYRRRALELTETLLRLDSSNPNAHIAMAWCLLWKHHFERARQHLEEALRLQPYEADRMNAIATGFLYLGKHEKALSLMNKVKDMAAFDLEFYRTDFGEIHYLMGNYPVAREHLDIGELKSLRAAFWRSATNGQLGRTDEARTDADLFLDEVRKIWVGEETPAPKDLLEWYFQFLPLAQPTDEHALREGLRAAGLPA